MRKDILASYIILIITLCFLIPVASAELSKLQIPLTVDFQSPNKFNLLWDGGSRLYDWNNATTPSDSNFTMIVYRELDTTVVCSSQVSAYQNLTTKMVDVVDVCKDLADNNNVSLAWEYGICKEERGGQKELLIACQADRDAAKGKADLYDSCEAQKNSMRIQLTNCTTSYQNTTKSSKAWPFVTGAACLFIGYLIWGRKKDTPSEYKDEGFESY